jgi:predicted MFS family arabinose efflux permease
MSSREGTIRAALGYPAFRSLLAGLAVSQVGDWLYNLALVTLVYQRTGSAMWAGAATAARVVPVVVLGPLGGVVADRFGRRGVMIASDLARLVLMLGLALVAAAHLPVLLAPVIAALATAAGAPYLPCVSAVTPRMVRDIDLPGANAARSAVTAIGVIAGPALGGVLLLIGSPATAFVVNALTFGLAVAFTVAIKDRRAFEVTRTRAARQAALARQIADGAAALRAHPAAVRLVGADILCSLVYGMQTVLLITVARQAGLGLHGYGYLFAAIGAGGLIGTAVAGRVARLPQHVALAGSLALVGLPTLAMPAAHWAPAAVLLAGFTGAGALCVEIMTETGLQRMLDDEVFGRAYGLALPASIAGIAAGSLIAPALVSAFGQSAALLVCGAVVTAYCAVAWRSRPAGAAATAGAPAVARPAVGAPMAGAPTVVMPVIAPAGPVPMPALAPGRDALVR